MIHSSPSSLLLLPSPPSPLSRTTLNSAYHAPISAAITATSKLSLTLPRPAVLVIAVATPILSSSTTTRRLRWEEAQYILAGVYSIIAAVCSELDIACYADAGQGSVDARVILVDHESGKEYTKLPDGSYENYTTNVLNLASFASNVAPWVSIFHPSSEAGYELRGAFLTLAESGRHPIKHEQVVAVPGGLAITSPTTKSDVKPKTQDNDYNTVCLGGTFDYLHPGHKLLLHATVLLMHLDPSKTSEMIIGISVQDLLKNKKFAQELQPWEIRVNNVLRFLSTVLNESATTYDAPPAKAVAATSEKPAEMQATFLGGRVLVRCVELLDPFGPTTEEKDIDAIVVSGETRSGGKAINDKRTAKDWKPLDVYEIAVLDAKRVTDEEAASTENFAAKISSSAIRQQRAEARERNTAA